MSDLFTRPTILTIEEKALIRAAKVLEVVPTEGHALVLNLAAHLLLIQNLDSAAASQVGEPG